MEKNIPKIIGNGVFVIGDKIGSGSFGDVYRAKTRNGKEIAIKFEPLNASKKCLEKEIAVSIHFSLFLSFDHFKY